jgi:hypothetical protein
MLVFGLLVCINYTQYLYKNCSYASYMCGVPSMIGIFTMLIGIGAIFAVAHFGPKLYANPINKKIKTALQRCVVYAMP